MLYIDNNVVLIFIFLPTVKHRYETFQNQMKNGFNKVQKNIQEMRLPILKISQVQTIFLTKTFS